MLEQYLSEASGAVLNGELPVQQQGPPENPIVPPGVFAKALNEESIADHFVLIYELLDECADFGYPQITETSILQVPFPLLSFHFHCRLSSKV